LRGPRWFAWFTGVVLLWFVFACGISGHWLVWDKLVQFGAIATTEWLDALPLFGEPIARNFLDNATLSGWFFTLMVFLHIRRAPVAVGLSDHGCQPLPVQQIEQLERRTARVLLADLPLPNR
jgi:quinol-cytochrome oxidoreductase complex cytochrome b subunit